MILMTENEKHLLASLVPFVDIEKENRGVEQWLARLAAMNVR